MSTHPAQTSVLDDHRPSPADAAPTVSRLRLCADVRSADAPLSALRVVLTTQVLCSVLRVFGGATAHWAVLDPGGSVPTGLVRAVGARGPAAPARTVRAVTDLLDGQPDLTVLPQGITAEQAATPVLRVGPIMNTRRGNSLPAQLDRLDDPLALRLALLRFPYAEPATLSTPRLRRAEETLDRWRFKVAGWHDRPPAPPPPERAAMLTALTDHLDTPMVLTTLHRLEGDAAIPSGTKFAAFTELDQVLGLALSRYIGRHHL